MLVRVCVFFGRSLSGSACGVVISVGVCGALVGLLFSGVGKSAGGFTRAAKQKREQLRHGLNISRGMDHSCGARFAAPPPC